MEVRVHGVVIRASPKPWPNCCTWIKALKCVFFHPWREQRSVLVCFSRKLKSGNAGFNLWAGRSLSSEANRFMHG